MTPSARLPATLRLLALLGLLALLLWPPEEPTLAGTVRMDGTPGAAPDDLGMALLDPPGRVLRDAGTPPATLELDGLRALDGTRLLVELPAGSPTLAASAPARPVANRSTALRFRLPPADTPRVVRLLGTGGAVLDSATVPPGASEGAFRIAPPRSGWTRWRVSTVTAMDTVEAWIAPGEPPRVLVVAGPPDWESRYLLRSLEAAGATISLVQALGRDNVVTTGAAERQWWTAEVLGDHDAVVLLPGARLPAAPDVAGHVARYVADGGGLLVAGAWRNGPPGDGAGTDEGGGASGAVAVATLLREVGLAGSVRTGGAARGDALEWSGPPELAPLPAVDVETATATFANVGPLAAVGARAEAGPVLLLAPYGAGRVAATGVSESWRWVTAGSAREHQAHWRTLVDWVATTPGAGGSRRAIPATGPVGTTVTLTPPASHGAPAPRTGTDSGAAEEVSATADVGLELLRPDGRRERVPPGSRFVAVDTGPHEILAADGAQVTAFRASSSPPAEDGGRAALTFLASASGGAALEPGPYRGAAVLHGQGGARTFPWRTLGFWVLAGVLVAEWSLRRLRGLP